MEVALAEDPNQNPDGRPNPDGYSSLDMLGASLKHSLSSVIGARQVLEQRWMEDLLQYRGQYDEDTTRKLQAAGDRSSVFLNITRVMTNQSVSQLSDLLFPSEDKNYGVSSTPNPTMDADLNNTEVVRDPQTGEPAVDTDTGEQVTYADVAAAARKKAREMARSMERQIDDQFVECRYAAEARKALHWAGIFGPAILAGPETFQKIRHKFAVEPTEDGSGNVSVLRPVEKRTAKARAVAPWDFYPDMSATRLEDCEYIYERSLMTAKQVRSLVKKKHYKEDNVRRVLGKQPRSTQMSGAGTVTELKQLSGVDQTATNNRYEVWTYHGPIDKDALIEAGVPLDPEDPLDEFNGIVVFCDGIVMKAALNPLDSEEMPYSVWNWHQDDFSIFGFGVPWLCRNEQRIVNTAWRMMLDNASKSAGPQIVAKRNALTPADGDATIRPWKVWWADETVTDVRMAFQVFDFPSVQTEISNILTMAKQFLTETAGLPPEINQGAGQTPNTLGGMAMLMNSSNTDRRRQVRDWDDNITVPIVTRFYHWNMQYHEDESIKGDYEVHARGSSALLLREQQAINLMALLDKYAAHPILQGTLKANATLRKVVQALHISPEELVKTEEEIEAERIQAQEQEPQEDTQIIVERMRSEQIQMRSELQQQLEAVKAEFTGEQKEADRQLRRDLAVLATQRADRELQMEAMRLSQTNNVSYQKILADLKKHRWKLNLDKSRFETEVTLKKQAGNEANYGLTDA